MFMFCEGNFDWNKVEKEIGTGLVVCISISFVVVFYSGYIWVNVGREI